MSEAIKIKEGGVDRSQNQINKLKTNTVGGGVCFWVPETERKTESKSIDANGTYTAEDEGLYGYSVLNVNVPVSSGVNGKDNPGGGTGWNDYNVNVDENGYLIENKIPSYIKIISPPGKLDYVDGEAIDLSGIIVKAYDSEGNEMQTLTADELSNEPQSADISKVSGEGKAIYDEIEVPYATSMHAEQYYRGDTLNREVDITLEDGVYIVNVNGLFAISREEKRFWYEYGDGEYYYSPKPNPSGGYRTLEYRGKNSIDGSDVYTRYIDSFDWTNGFDGWTVIRDHPLPNTLTSPSAIDIVLAGERVGGGTQKITVIWNRTGDLMPLSDTYEIHVEAVETGE